MLKRFLPITVFFFCCTWLPAQESGRYHIQQFTTDNGMPSNGVKGLQWDEANGFLWVATEAGLTRYNGMEFTNFTKENTGFLSHERMAYLVKNDEGYIFGADVNGSLVRVEKNHPVYLPLPQLAKAVGLKKRYYLHTSSAYQQEKILPFIQESGSNAWEYVLHMPDSSMLVIDVRNQSYLFTPQQELLRPVTTIPDLRWGFINSGEAFLVTKDRTVYRAQNRFSRFEKINMVDNSGTPLLMNKPADLLYWEKGMDNPILFSGTNAWLIHFRNNRLEAELICTEVPTFSYIRYAQYSRRHRTLFIGTDSKGIILVSENRVSSVKKKNTDIRERNAYYAQVELPEGKVLTNEGHIIGGDEQTRFPLPINGKFNFTVYRTGDSLLWFSQINEQLKRNLLHTYDYATGRKKVFDKIPVIQEGFAITRMNGQYYLATNRGIAEIKNDTLEYIFPQLTLPGQSAPYSIVSFAPDVTGVASCEGVILYDIKRKTVDTLLKKPGFCFRSLWKYKDYVFIGSYGSGYYIWKNGVLKSMPLDKNNFLLYTHCFMPDEKGFLWISTNRGLFKAQLSDLLQAFDTGDKNVYYHYFGKNDGMDITEMNGGCYPCAIQLRNKTISFPTMDGLLWVNPENAIPLLPEGGIYLDEFLAGSKALNPDSLGIRPLSSSVRDITIRLGFSSWCNKENVYLEYQLNNSGNWIAVDVNKGAYITLNNLMPGSYSLLIRKMNGFGINNYSYKEIRFSISTPWFKTWWFFLLCLATVTALISLYFRYRTRQLIARQRRLEEQVTEKTKALQQQNEVLEKNNTIKTRLISIISHDIITPLKFLTAAGKNLSEKRKLMAEELQEETIKEMTNTSQELQLLSTNILNWIKYQNENRLLVKESFDLHEMVRQVLGLLQSLARQKQLLIENNVPPGFEVHQFYEPLKILIYNLLTNAIHFTGKGNIVVAARKEKEEVIVSVADKGIGMTPEQVQRIMADEVVITSANVDNKKGHGLGFLIIKDLVKTMGGRLQIESEKGNGTTVSVTVPVAKENAG